MGGPSIFDASPSDKAGSVVDAPPSNKTGASSDWLSMSSAMHDASARQVEHKSRNKAAEPSANVAGESPSSDPSPPSVAPSKFAAKKPEVLQLELLFKLEEMM